MKKLVSYILIGALLINLNTFSVKGNDDILYEKIDQDHVTKGLEYEYKEVFTKDGWVDVHTLIMDLTNKDLSVEFLKSTEEVGLKDGLTDLVEQYNESNDSEVVAAINASFFQMSGAYSDPIGINYDEGYTYGSHNYNVGYEDAASIIQTLDGNIEFGFFDMSIEFTNDDGRELYISGINKVDPKDTVIIYNQSFDTSSRRIDDLGDYYKLTVGDNIITEITEPGVTCEIPSLEEGYIFVIPEEIVEYHLEYFSVGTRVYLEIDSSLDIENMESSIGGGAIIIKDGEAVELGLTAEPNYRHPRTAVGVTEDGNTMIAMVVDGRGESIGATHDELITYLMDYGVYNAISLDGGGSSTLAARELGEEDIDVFNEPSGGYQRNIINGIGIATEAETGPIATIEIKTSTDIVFKNNPIELELIGYDENYNPVEVDNRSVLWTVEQGMTGTWTEDSFTPTSEGDGVLKCHYNDLIATANVKSLGEAIDLNVSPRVLGMDFKEVSSFKVTGLDISGYEGRINNMDITYTVDDTTLGAFVNGEFVTGTKSGVTKVKLQVGDRWTTAYIAVGNEEQVYDEFEEATFTQRTYPEGVIGTSGIDHERFFDTDMSYIFDYEFKSSADPQAVYMMFEDFIIENPTDIIGLQVYGNNSGHSLKGRVVDANGEGANLTFASEIDFDGWKKLTVDLPSDLEYPITLDRLYVVAIHSFEDFAGSINVDQMTIMSRIQTDDFKFDDEGFINDELRLDMAPSGTTELKVFGATSFRNRLLDNILLDKVYEKMNDSEYAVFAGYTDIDEEKIEVPMDAWDNEYHEFVVDGVRFIQLATGTEGLRYNDYTQYDKIDETLRTASENTIVFIGSRDPLNTFPDEREGDLLHSILSDYQQLTGKTVMYIRGGGYTTDVTIKDGVRYFDLSGLWYKITDRYVNLNETFYSLNFYIDNGEVEYMFEPLFPTIELN